MFCALSDNVVLQHKKTNMQTIISPNSAKIRSLKRAANYDCHLKNQQFFFNLVNPVDYDEWWIIEFNVKSSSKGNFLIF